MANMVNVTLCVFYHNTTNWENHLKSLELDLRAYSKWGNSQENLLNLGKKGKSLFP